MTQLSAALKKQVNDKIIECQAIIKAKLGKDIKMPTVSYNKGGTTAGTANQGTWHIELNPVLLVENQNQMINDTVPHEFAHLVTGQLYPDTKRTWSKKGRPHGAEWQYIMRVLGVNPSRCHTMDVSSVKRIKAGSIKVACSTCKREFSLGPVRAARLKANPKGMWCCRSGSLVPVGTVVTSTPTPVVATVKPTPSAVTFETGSKMDLCATIYKLHRGTKSRSEIIAFFVSQAKCTDAGASTYYATLKKKLG